MYEVGTGKSDITAHKRGIGMMGYGMTWNTVEDVETPLHARAYFFHDRMSGKDAAIVVCDMAFVTHSIKSGVLKKLSRKHSHINLREENLMLTAQHTHSGPGGYSHYGLYNITIPGFVPEVYQKLVNGIVEAIVEAEKTKRHAKLHFDSEEFAPEIEVGFNRSMKAYMSNPEAKAQGIDKKDTHLALNREMTMLRIDGVDGEKIGAINWFGLHNTSVHNDNHSICWDNKGYAAQYLEQDLQKEVGAENFLGAFAQSEAGDVTPNHIWDKKKKWTRGPFVDDFESAKAIGKMQYDHARKLFDKALHGHEVTGGLDWGHMHVNFANVLCDPEYTSNAEGARTMPAVHGLAFLAGTKEGPGMPPVVQFVARSTAFFVKVYEKSVSVFMKKERRNKIKQKYKLQGKKVIIIEAGERRVLGTSDVKNLIVPAFADDTIKNFKTLHPEGWEEDKPWVPHVLPLQLLVIGDIAFIAIPAEPTTIAAERIRKVVEDVLEARGIHRVIIAPYANAYCGYITTNEEYQFQFYEGGHTVFGQWTLAAFQTKYKQLAEEMSKKADYRQIPDEVRPPNFTEEELNRRTYGSPRARQDNQGENSLLSII